MSSFTQKKQSLFGKKGDEVANPSKPIEKLHSSSEKLQGPSSGGSIASSLSSTAKSKKIDEARDWNKRGLKHLQTSMFQWNPDHLAAAPCFENSSNAYKLAGELDLAKEMMQESGSANEAAGCLSAAAVSFGKAAQLCQAWISTDS